MTDPIFRVHPFLNIARVGNSKNYYISPETAAGHVVDSQKGIYGGLPIRAESEDTFIEEADLRDDNGDLRRQAARFRVFVYQNPQTTYPNTDPGEEIKIGSTVKFGYGSKTVKDILWTVHLANKKANNYKITGNTDVLPNWGAENKYTELGVINYENGKLPPIRNAGYGADLADENRLKTLVIDAGPRAIASSTNGSTEISFDLKTTPSYVVNGAIASIDNYPVSFPSQHFPDMATPLGQIDTLGDMAIEKGTGRLLVKGGYGKAEAIIDKDKGCADPTNPPGGFDAIDNNCWFDDTSDGPVTATVVFDDNSTSEVVAGWFVCTDPGFAPQVRNVVSAWDDMFDVWVRELDLMPNLYSNGQFNPDYQPPFDSELQPIFHGAMLQQWSTALPSQALNGHKFVGVIKPSDDPSVKLPNFEQLIRNPDDADNDGLVPMNYTGKQSTTTQNRMMPLALGDAMKSFLTLSPSQYFFMKQWRAGKSTTKEPLMGIGEQLDRAVLENCLGGRYSPGIDVTFIIRDVNLYIQKWRGATGPFRFNMQPMDYTKATKGSPFLGVGYLPLRTAKVEPGDICKFMSLPWHTDYNSCAIHEPDPNPEVGVDQGGTHGTTQMANTLYWSWPAQRPVQIYPKDLCTYDADTKTWSIGGQLFSVRGDGTLTDFPQKRGAYQDYFTFIKDWHMVGFVLQGTQVPDDHGGDYGADKFIEVKSLFTDVSDPVTPWPSGFNVIPESPTS